MLKCRLCQMLPEKEYLLKVQSWNTAQPFLAIFCAKLIVAAGIRKGHLP